MAEPIEKEEVAPVEQTSAPQADLLNPPPSRFEKPAGVNTTNFPGHANPPLPVEGNGYFSNLQFVALILAVPYILKRFIPFFNTGFKTYVFLLILTGPFTAIAYWTAASTYGPRKNEKVALPGRPIEEYLDIKDPELNQQFHGHNKINYQQFHDAYFEGKIDVKGDMLDVLEYRHDWANFNFTPKLFKYVVFKMIPDILFHSQSQDEDQIQDVYDRGDDFYEWFLGPRMIYTGGMVRDTTRAETLEELQDNKLSMVCEKLDLKKGDRMLDIGCGWGTLAAFAAKNFETDVTGITLSKNQAKFGNDRIAKNGISSEQARILNKDYREIPKHTFNKISCLEMAEHVGIRRYSTFLNEVYNLLDDDGTMVFQVAGLRPHWQYEDLIWGLFMNEHIFPGADASCSLGWVINQLENAGFEVKSIDVLGVHYSVTILRWYNNWLSNKEKVLEKYGERWFRIWTFFLASSVIIARNGGSSVFQITVQKNLNATRRIEGLHSHHAPLHRLKSDYKTVVA
ncbi:hypothetical protein E3Q24_00930 [Wallemia mellicola]|nr:hypothetical protein E3Q24_00930 [Wallemia mellicola]